MSEDVTLTWISERDPHTGRARPNDGMLLDGKVVVARVARVVSGPSEGQWTWSMFATGLGGFDVQRPGGDRGRTDSREAAKAAAEGAYRKLVSLHPGNGDAVRKQNEAVRERSRLWETGEGYRRTEKRRLEG